MQNEGRYSEIAATAKALANPVRLKIIDILLERRACLCGEIVDITGMAQSTVSQHLKVLKKAGLLKGQIDGPATCYCLDIEGFKKAALCVSSFLELPAEYDPDCD